MALEGAGEPSGCPLHILQLFCEIAPMGIATVPRNAETGFVTGTDAQSSPSPANSI